MLPWLEIPFVVPILLRGTESKTFVSTNDDVHHYGSVNEWVLLVLLLVTFVRTKRAPNADLLPIWWWWRGPPSRQREPNEKES